MKATLFELVGKYIDHLLQTGHRLEQVVAARRQLDYFLVWAENERLDSIYQFDADHPALYLSHLKRNRDLISFGPIGTKTQRERLTKLRRFLESRDSDPWLTTHTYDELDRDSQSDSSFGFSVCLRSDSPPTIAGTPKTTASAPTMLK